MIESINRSHRGFYMRLNLNADDSFKAERPSYNYYVETPTKAKFIGMGFCPAPHTLKNTAMILDELLGFITLKPGDTDREYFDRYTPEQLAWAQSFECEVAQSELPEN